MTFENLAPWLVLGGFAVYCLHRLRKRLSLHSLARHGGRRMLFGRIHRNRELLEARDRAGRTPLIAAAEADNDGIVVALLEEGADANARANDGTTALMAAAAANGQTSVRWLLRHGAQVDAIDELGRTALHHAAERGAIHAAASLMLAPASTAMLDARGRTAEQVARSNGHNELADLVAGLLPLDAEQLSRLDVKSLALPPDMERQAMAAPVRGLGPGHEHRVDSDDDEERSDLFWELDGMVPTTDEVRALRKLGRPIDNRFVEWASDELLEGESPALRKLAETMPPFDQALMEALVDRAFAERHIAPCDTAERALVLLAAAWARYVIDEEADGCVLMAGLQDLFDEFGVTPPELQDLASVTRACRDVANGKSSDHWPGVSPDEVDRIVTARVRTWFEARPPATGV